MLDLIKTVAGLMLMSAIAGLCLGVGFGVARAVAQWHDEEDNAIIYRADPESSIVDVNKHETDLPKYNWRPSIFMPRCASRITLEITRIRIEHLQAINEVDAIAEGAPWAACGSPQDGSHKAGYAKLWESIHGPGSWDANPWVWVIEFKGLPA
jgi:hypothetical protein